MRTEFLNKFWFKKKSEPMAYTTVGAAPVVPKSNEELLAEVKPHQMRDIVYKDKHRLCGTLGAEDASFTKTPFEFVSFRATTEWDWPTFRGEYKAGEDRLKKWRANNPHLRLYIRIETYDDYIEVLLMGHMPTLKLL